MVSFNPQLRLANKKSWLVWSGLFVILAVSCRRPEPPLEQPLATESELRYEWHFSEDLMSMAVVSYEFMRDDNVTYRTQPTETDGVEAMMDRRFVWDWQLTAVHRMQLAKKYAVEDSVMLKQYGLWKDEYVVAAEASFRIRTFLENGEQAMDDDYLRGYENLSRIKIDTVRVSLEELNAMIDEINGDRERQKTELERCYMFSFDSLGRFSSFEPREYWR